MSSVYTEKQNITLERVSLGYDLSAFSMYCRTQGNLHGYAALNQLSGFHGMDGRGFVDFSALFGQFNSASANGPGALFVFCEPTCKGEIVLVYDKFDSDLCLNNTLKNVPVITKPYVLDFSAHTMTTAEGVSVKWIKHYSLPPNCFLSELVETGELDYPDGFFASTTKSEEGEVAVRVIDGHYSIVENTLSGAFLPGTYGFRSVTRTPLHSDIFDQGVCFGGQVNPNYRWAAPEIVKLIKKNN